MGVHDERMNNRTKKSRIVGLIVRVILYLFSVCSICYSVIVASINSGSKFFLIWDLIGVGLIIIALMIRANLWSRIGITLKIAIVSVLSVGFSVFLVLLIMIFSEYGEQETKQVDYLIILGAQVRTDGPSTVLKFRLDKAAEYLAEYPDAKCIVSGGKGKNEPCSESEGMKRYLVGKGIAEERIFTEDRSTNTRENFLFSSQMIPDSATVGVVTNNFHMKRAMFLAEKTGIENPVAIVADSTALFAPNNVLREVCGLMKDIVLELM